MDIKHEHNLAAHKRNQLSTFVVVFFFALLLLPGIPVMLDHIIYFQARRFRAVGRLSVFAGERSLPGTENTGHVRIVCGRYHDFYWYQFHEYILQRLF
jgi:hypothetical protein